LNIQKHKLDWEIFGNASVEQLKVIVDELVYWDGSFEKRTGNRSFSTMLKSEADFVQYAMSVVYDTQITICKKQRDGDYRVLETATKNTTIESIVPVSLDSNFYCFTTSTKYWVARRNDRIFITGNTDWSKVREINHAVGTQGGTSSGIIPFMGISDRSTLSISQG
jgi:hypothetical protein